MSDFYKIPYYDLRLEKQTGRLPEFFGRQKELERLTRVAARQRQNNAAVVGPGGIGKTAFLRAWAGSLVNMAAFKKQPIVELPLNGLQAAGAAGAPLAKYKDALGTIGNGVIIIDNFGQLVQNQPQALHNFTQLLQPLLEHANTKIILSLETGDWEWCRSQAPNFFRNFDPLVLEQQPEAELKQIVKALASQISKKAGLEIKTRAIEQILNYCAQFPSLGQLPQSAALLLDEVLAAVMTKPGAIRELDADIINAIVSEKTGVPAASLTQSQRDKLKNLLPNLETAVIGQTRALKNITSVIQRAGLGLKNQSRPLGSFLLLGPSGVGKTETAKTLAQQIFGKPSAFLRIDMSEFAEPHTVARLIGSPPGYVGSNEGGQLTNHLKNHPHSLILLDEIEKAHAKIYDIFLQVLDDGRLTSGQGETVDATHTIFMATSNLCVDEIISHYQAGGNIHDPLFLKNNIVPVLSKYFRMEFLNRFDGILVYNPLSFEALTDIAMLEIKKIEARVAEHNIKFSITREVLEQKVKTLADPRFGARPVKRFVEELCENLLAEQLLK
jgi:ATP-dependent Clp protease ATP-binding subunit ClpA